MQSIETGDRVTLSGDYPTARSAGLLLLEELRDAYEILEDYHDKCSEELEKTIDYDANETEHCSSFQETYGKDFDRLTCHEHDKLRRWAKLLVTAREANAMMTKKFEAKQKGGI